MIINQIGQGGGLEPTGTITITNNGSYSVTPYANAEVNVAGGGTPIVLDELNVTPSTSLQTLTPPTGTDGYNVVSVDAVDSTIDSNIQASNIKQGVSILGVNGNYSGPDSCLEFTVNNGTLKKGSKGINIGGASKIGGYCLYSVCGFGDSGYTDNSMKGAALLNSSNLTTIDGSSAMYQTFKGQTGITSTGLDYVKTINGSWACHSAFYGCTSLIKSGLSRLESISGSNPCFYMFQNCSSLTDAGLKNLKTISGFNYYMFAFCTSLTMVEFDSLDSITSNSALFRWFWRDSNLKNIYFRALKSTSFGSSTGQFNQMLQDVTGCTVHFPSNLQSVIGSWSDVTSGFGGTSTIVLYDLPATE